LTDPLVKIESPVKPIEKQEILLQLHRTVVLEQQPQQRLAVSGNNATVENADIKAAMTPDGSNTASVTDNIQPAVYKELDTETDDERKVYYWVL
jgi:hypothetical protein